MNTQNDALEAVRRVLTEYSSQELLIQDKLESIRSKREALSQGKQISIPLNFETYQEVLQTKELAIKRNKALKKELDVSMGKLRSKRCYSPAEDNLHRIIEKYSEILSRPEVQ